MRLTSWIVFDPPDGRWAYRSGNRPENALRAMNKATKMVLALALVPWLAILPVGAAESQANPASPGATGAAAGEDPQATSVSAADGSASGGQTAKTKRLEKPDQAVQRAGNGNSAAVQQMVKDFREHQKARLEYAANSTGTQCQRGKATLREQLRRMIEEQRRARAFAGRSGAGSGTLSLPGRKEVIEAARKGSSKQDRSRVTDSVVGQAVLVDSSSGAGGSGGAACFWHQSWQHARPR
jgi:hypothetical protein